MFATLRKKAGLPNVEFQHIRDGAYTASVENGADFAHAQILAGHKTGMSDRYVKRNPMMVADVCEAIERHYFKVTV